MAYTQPKEIKIKEKQDKFLRQQLEKEREQQLLEEIERTEKERVKKKGKSLFFIISRPENPEAIRHLGLLPVPADFSVQVWVAYG